MRRAFVLTDLWHQADAILREVRAWPRECILQWLRQYGEVRKVTDLPDDDAFRFQSRWGPDAVFELSETGRMTLIGDHFRVPAWRDGDTT